MRPTQPFFLTLLLLACNQSPKPESPGFDTAKALQALKTQTEQGPDFVDKKVLLRDLDWIMQHDSSFFKNKENLRREDSARFSRQKILYEVLHLDDISSFNLHDSTDIYRLSISRAFNHETILITIQNRKNVATLTVQGHSIDPSCAFLVGTKPFDQSCIQITRNKKIALTASQWKAFEQVVDQNEFWDLYDGNDEYGLDGSTWRLEASKHAEYSDEQVYKRMHRWAPAAYSGMYRIGMFLLNLSKEDWGEIY